MQPIQENAQKELMFKINQSIEDELRTNAFPPIKGKITKGKLRWRGIIRVQDGKYQWVEQRGKRITSKYGLNPNIDTADRSEIFTVFMPIIKL